MACSSLKDSRRFGSAHRLHLQRLLWSPIGSFSFSGRANGNTPAGFANVLLTYICHSLPTRLPGSWDRKIRWILRDPEQKWLYWRGQQQFTRIRTELVLVSCSGYLSTVNMESMFFRHVGWLSPVNTAFISPKVALFIVIAVITCSTLLKELRQATKISHNSRSSERDSNQEIPEYEAGRDILFNHIKIKLKRRVLNLRFSSR